MRLTQPFRGTALEGVHRAARPGDGNAAREGSMTLQAKLVWAAVSILGAVAFAMFALFHGETVNAAWLVIAAICIYVIAYRFYGLWIAGTVFGVDPKRPTPAYRHNDGLDYVPTNKYVLFGHHFAAIAGAGPLVGPVLAAQMGAISRARSGSSPARSSPGACK